MSGSERRNHLRNQEILTEDNIVDAIANELQEMGIYKGEDALRVAEESNTDTFLPARRNRFNLKKIGCTLAATITLAGSAAALIVLAREGEGDGLGLARGETEIGKMKVGSTGWTQPWAVSKIKGFGVVIHKGYSVDQDGLGTSKMFVERTKDGYSIETPETVDPAGDIPWHGATEDDLGHVTVVE